jgi:hypothetical protein
MNQHVIADPDLVQQTRVDVTPHAANFDFGDLVLFINDFDNLSGNR